MMTAPEPAATMATLPSAVTLDHQPTARNRFRRFDVVGDPRRVFRAIATNQIARFFPGLYVRLTGETGRGDRTEEAPEDLAQYYRDSLDDYVRHIQFILRRKEARLAGSVVLEYGPGDFPGVAALAIANGAEKVFCVDRFPLLNVNQKNARALAELIDGCTGTQRERLIACLRERTNPAAGLDHRYVEYLVRPSGLSGLNGSVDIVLSRAVLEHVDDLDATFQDMFTALKPGGIAVHKVDLRSHGLHRSNPLDFLVWPDWLWRSMYSHKGAPNRHRVDAYRRVVSRLPVMSVEFLTTSSADALHVNAVRPKLAKPFRGIPDEDLACLGFWLLMRKQV